MTRPLENTDVVLWYTLGTHHIVRPEDWPVMPCAYIGFHLKPVGFFDGNPALDLPPSRQPSDHCGHHGNRLQGPCRGVFASQMPGTCFAPSPAAFLRRFCPSPAVPCADPQLPVSQAR